jgi:hypothetical protein
VKGGKKKAVGMFLYAKFTAYFVYFVYLFVFRYLRQVKMADKKTRDIGEWMTRGTKVTNDRR